MNSIFYWIKLSFFLSMITISLITFQRTDLFHLIIQADFEGVQLLLNDNIPLLLMVTFILMIIQNAFTLIPLLLLITFNMVLFGFFYGVLWSWLTSVIAAFIIFLVARYIFQDRLVEKLNTDLKDKIEANGLLYVFIGRVFPFVPTSLVNIVSAVSSIHLKHFLAATACGNLIYFFLLGLLPMSLIKLGLNYYTIGLLLLVIIVVFNIYTFIIKKKKSTWSMKSMSG